MDFSTIQFSSAGGVARLIFNRPDRLNSFNQQMHEEVAEALRLIREDGSVRALLIGANGRGFCAGQDLADRNVAPDADMPDLGYSLETYYNPLIRALRELPMPVVCAVNGVAAGAGANIALACDIVIAGRSAKFVQAFAKIGLVPDSGGTWVLPRLVGRARATALAMLGEAVPAEQAEAWGMIWQCVDDAELMPAAEKLAAHLATQPTRGLAYIKQALNASPSNSLDAQLDLERDMQRAAGRTEDYREGVTAFFEKRQPTFKGE
ncbi:2-(1,2-epoxy-1,2-dihydrophenyl)acetyl-CoA isomerase PaaG [Mangrovitalea sediminis]|uniref:2-(1,2-epoxy-1,2-dihydrophenyl)acetyl-CoA isomerase PaaG n=1 Tax=Mangrovitalea sediminis TaxID=1982043 RepID=UPI000BE5E4AE|nr:2-(1,2-epoxy-1,2-dihydrophenyl)acetyl-CoA isomerase PaaG [Mangrovitalea sediminis]